MRLRQEGQKLRVLSKEEVAAHNTPTDLWMIVHGRVFDVTPFVKSHPGGPEVLFEYAGTDCTESFDEVGHSQDSIDMLRPLCQGVINKDDKFKQEVHEKKHHALNASVGESKYWKENVSRRKHTRKKFKLKDGEYLVLFGLLAFFAGLGYLYLLSKRDSFLD